MRTLNQKQKDLLALVTDNPGLNTWGYCELRGDHTAYPSDLRDRLFRLANRGLIRFIECVSSPRWVVERRWYPVTD